MRGYKIARIRAVAGVASLSLVACGGPAETTPPGPAAQAQVAQPELAYQISADEVEGTLTGNDGAVRFSATAKDALYDVVVEVNGAVLSNLFSRTQMAFELDGFVAGSGAPTQMRATDRALLLAMDHAMLEDPALRANPIGDVLERAVSLWSEMSDTFPMTRSVEADPDKSWTSLCSSCGQFVAAAHDCNVCDQSNPQCCSLVQLGSRQPQTEYLINNVWTNAPQDHPPLTYERGDCYGRCGDGCSPWPQRITEDCTNHDQCVRNGHVIVSPYCDDEFAFATDDDMLAPVCDQTSTSTSTIACPGATYISSGNKLGIRLLNCGSCPAGYLNSPVIVTTPQTLKPTCKRTTVVATCP